MDINNDEGVINFVLLHCSIYSWKKERSRPLASIIAEAKQAILDGFPEITLLGQNVNSYKNGYHNFENLLFELC